MDKAGKYVLLEPLGKGGMGIVYKARDPDIDRTVAVKVIHFDSAGKSLDRDELQQRFLREAKAAGRLSHPNIVAVYDIGQEGDLLYIVMQHIEGKSLHTMLAEGKTFSLPEALNIAKMLCRALDYAHRKGVIHRDLKPANVLLDQSGRPYLADFGVAKLAQATLTLSGLTFGTPGYMSPEQASGKKIDSRSDIFSLGVLLYVLLTGKEPFSRKGMGLTTVMNRILTVAPEPPSKLKQDLPAGLDIIVNKALAKKPEDRYQSGLEMAMALETQSEAAGTTLVFQLDDKIRPPARPRPEGKKFLAVASLITCFVLAATAGVMFIPKLIRGKPSLPESTEKDAAVDAAKELPPSTKGEDDNPAEVPKKTEARPQEERTATEKKLEQEILNLLERQRRAEEEKDLPALLQDIGSADLASQKKEEALLLFNYYDRISSVYSNISIVFPAAGKAEARFHRRITAVYKKTGEQKVLADSVQLVALDKRGQKWNVVQTRSP